MILAKLNKDFVPKYRKLFTFASQLKAGKGLTIAVAVIEGEFTVILVAIFLSRDGVCVSIRIMSWD